MICLWSNGRFLDAFFNTMNDSNWIEVTIINLGLDPLTTEFLDYPSNPNAHNPKKIEDSDKSIEWFVDKLVQSAIVSSPEAIPEVSKNYNYIKSVQALTRIINKQKEILDKYLLEGKNPPIPGLFVTETPVENKVVMQPFKKMVPSETDFIFKGGRRLKRYTTEKADSILHHFDSLKSVANYLLSLKINWSNEPGPNGEEPFFTKLNRLK